jgi:hypothetical protein
LTSLVSAAAGYWGGHMYLIGAPAWFTVVATLLGALVGYIGSVCGFSSISTKPLPIYATRFLVPVILLAGVMTITLVAWFFSQLFNLSQLRD